MTTERGDLAFPACCACCPHRESLTAACTHALRQSLLGELAEDRSCPVYAESKTDAMRRLSTQLSG